VLRYAVLGLICLVSDTAWAQQVPPPDRTPTASSSAPVQPSKAVVAMEEPLPGDYWTYEVRDEITGTVSGTRTNIVTGVTPTDIGMRFKIAHADTTNKEVSVTYDRSWNLIRNGPWQYWPYNATFGIQTPLTVGKTWTFQSTDTNSNGTVWKRSGASKVVGQEAVTTRAGTFEAFKIETTSSSRNFKDPSRIEELTVQNWYAPAIDHWVKRTVVVRFDSHLKNQDTFELVEYGRNQ
jgi:hypothetical protein